MSRKPETAFILAAGLGTRMRPITDSIPKPMVEVGGQTVIDRILDKLEAEKVRSIAVNLHYKPDILKRHLSERKPDIHFSHEEELLDTGGGVKKILPFLGNAPFYHINGDAWWSEGRKPALQRLSEAWNPEIMDILMLLQPVKSMVLTEGIGDYDIDSAGQATRRLDRSGRFMFTGVRITTPEIFKGAPDGKFSFLTLMDAAQEKGRLYGIVHDADWHHISTPKDLERVNRFLAAHG